MKTRIIGGAIVAGIALMMSVACSAAKEQDPTPVKQFKITPASGSRTPAPSATATAPGTPASQGTPGAGGGSTVSISASNLLFDKTKLTASAGTVKIDLDNKDAGVPHNIDVYEGKDASGKSLGKTDIVAGPTKQELTLVLKPGTYYFQCDVHLATMSGTLTVN
jgi:plastocyanin